MLEVSSFARQILCVWGIVLMLVATASPGLAGSVVWTGAGTDPFWDSPANWNTGAVPAGSDDVTVGPAYPDGEKIKIAGDESVPVQIRSLVYNSGSSSPNLGEGGYLRISSGNISVGLSGPENKRTARVNTTMLFIPGSGNGVNTWDVQNGTLQVASQIAVAGTGAPTITKTGTGSLGFDVANQTYAGNWDITGNIGTNFSGGFGSGAVALRNTIWVLGYDKKQSLAFGNDITLEGNLFLSTKVEGTATLSGKLSGSGNTIFVNTDGGNVTPDATIILAGSANLDGARFRVCGTLQFDAPGYLSDATTVTLGLRDSQGNVRWNVAEKVADSVKFSNENSSTGFAEIGMLATGTTTINAAYNLNADSSKGANLQVNVVEGGTLVLAGAVTDSGGTTARSLTKVGAGKAILSGDADYQGGTTVSAGALFVNSSSGSGPVSVASGATLGGTGKICPATGKSISVAGAIAPGGDAGSVGTLTIDGAASTAGSALATFASGASFDFDIDNRSSDCLALANGKPGAFAFNNNVIRFKPSGKLAAGQRYVVFRGLGKDNFTGLKFGPNNAIVSGLTIAGLPAGIGGANRSTLALVNGDIVLNVVP